MGLKLADAPPGRPLALKVTLPLNPFTGATDTVYVVAEFVLMVCEAGVALRVKFVMTNVTVVFRETPPLVPVTVNV